MKPKKITPATPCCLEDIASLPYIVRFPTDGKKRVLRKPCYLEVVNTTRIGHVFAQLPSNPWDPGPRYIVSDFILEQTGTSGCNGRMSSTANIDFNAHGCYGIIVQARDRRGQFVVCPPPRASVVMSAYAGRQWVDQSQGDFFDPYPMGLVYDALVGVAPVLGYQYFGITHATNAAVIANFYADLGGAISFRRLAFGGYFPSRNLTPSLAKYKPLSYALPFGIPGPDSIPFVMFSYTTDSPADPGPFVHII